MLHSLPSSLWYNFNNNEEGDDVSSTKLLLENNNGVFLYKKDFDQESNWRSDDCYKFIYSLKGTIDYQTNRRQLTLHDQQFILFNPQDEHKQLPSDVWVYTVMVRNFT